jgi:beta-1,4-mannosyl-glycoprotein beta-1,4-N-acetylglucosaminyltransferase
MKIVDAFMFYNELDMLEYRLALHNNYVDYFIIVEATRTHNGAPKPLFFELNKDRFSEYADKIIHIVVDGLQSDPKHVYNRQWNDEVWMNENKHRNGIELGLQQLSLDNSDYMIISDLDELINPEVLKMIKEENISFTFANVIQDLYYYNLCCKNREQWTSAKIVNYWYYVSHFKRVPQQCRVEKAPYSIEYGGWHLSYFGDVEYIKNKLQNSSHQEYNSSEYINDEKIIHKMITCQDLFSRPNEKLDYIPIEQNDHLPPLYNLFLPMHK